MAVIEFDEATHRYLLDGAQVPSVSGILRATGLAPNLDHIPRPIFEHARRRGNVVHGICERIDRGEDVDVEPGLESYVDAYRLFLRESRYEPQDTEQIVYHPEYLYAGRLDARGWLHSERVIIDRKCTADIDHVATPVQLAAYTGAYLALNPLEHIDTIFALHLRRDGTYTLHPYSFADEWPVWMAALTIYRRIRRRKKETRR